MLFKIRLEPGVRSWRTSQRAPARYQRNTRGRLGEPVMNGKAERDEPIARVTRELLKKESKCRSKDEKWWQTRAAKRHTRPVLTGPHVQGLTSVMLAMITHGRAALSSGLRFAGGSKSPQSFLERVVITTPYLRSVYSRPASLERRRCGSATLSGAPASAARTCKAHFPARPLMQRIPCYGARDDWGHPPQVVPAIVFYGSRNGDSLNHVYE